MSFTPAPAPDVACGDPAWREAPEEQCMPSERETDVTTTANGNGAPSEGANEPHQPGFASNLLEEARRVFGSTRSAEDILKKKAQLQVMLEESILNIRLESARYSKKEKLPWLNDKGEFIWSRSRIMVASRMRSHNFEVFMGIVILGNVGLIWLETDLSAQCFPEYLDRDLAECPTSADHPNQAWLWITNLCLLIMYTLEALLGIFSQRRVYFENKWNLLDFTVVVTGWLAELLTLSEVDNSTGMFPPQILRIFRVARLMRSFRIILTIRELYVLINGIMSSFKAMFFGMILLLCMLLFWSILMVTLAHEVNSRVALERPKDYATCPRCKDAYKSVYESILTLFQTIVAGDSWGQTSLPILNMNWFLLPVFLGVLMSVALGIMNLILAVIVDSASEAREQDIERKRRDKQQALLTEKITLLKLCHTMDTDYSGTLTVKELKEAWDHFEGFKRVMIALDVGEGELDNVFKVVDADGSGEVDYKEFVDKLFQLRSSDSRMSLALLSADMQAALSKLDAIQPTLELVEKHEAMLNRHSHLLEQIDFKLGWLLALQSSGKPGAPNEDGAVEIRWI